MAGFLAIDWRPKLLQNALYMHRSLDSNNRREVLMYSEQMLSKKRTSWCFHKYFALFNIFLSPLIPRLRHVFNAKQGTAADFGRIGGWRRSNFVPWMSLLFIKERYSGL